MYAQRPTNWRNSHDSRGTTGIHMHKLAQNCGMYLMTKFHLGKGKRKKEKKTVKVVSLFAVAHFLKSRVSHLI